MRSLFCALVLVGVALAGPAHASHDCFYNGRVHDDRTGDPVEFTGEYTCKDRATKKLVKREHYVRGKREGESAQYHPQSGKLEEAAVFHDGKRDGPLRRYTDGVIYLEQNYRRGKLAGLQKEYKDGKLSRLYLVGDDGRPDTQLYFNSQGQLTMLDCRTRAIGRDDAAWCGFNGKQSTVTLYGDDGKKRATEQHLAGKKHGMFRTFNGETGAVLAEEHYQNGERLPAGQAFDPNGNLLVKATCAGKTCTETQYFEGGKEIRKVTVKEGPKLLKETEYYQNGKRSQEIAFSDGSQLSITSYYDNGQIESKGPYIRSTSPYSWRDYEPDGVIESFAYDGSPLARITYQRGERHGPAVRHVERDGKRYKHEAVYQKGRMVLEKIYSGDTLLEETEYHPDGSTRSHREHKQVEGKKI